MAAAPALAASRKISRGWTMLASSVPTVMIARAQHPVLRIEQHDAELLDRPAPVLRQQHLRQHAWRRDLDALAPDRASASGGPVRRQRGFAPLARCRCPAMRRRSSNLHPRQPVRSRRARPAPRSRDPAHSRWRGRARGPPRAARCRRAPSHPARCSFSRGRSCAATPFIVHHPCYTSGADAPRCPPALCLLSLRTLFGASTERNRPRAGRHRRGACRRRRALRDAEFAEATAALQQSHEAVEQRDYRLALSRALDASQRAQDAARQAAEGQARARSEAEVGGSHLGRRACSSSRPG